MKRALLIINLFLLFTIIACKKGESGSKNVTPVITPPIIIPPQPTLTNNDVKFTSEVNFANSFSSYGFKNPNSVTLDRIANTAGYNSVYGFTIPTANQVKGFKWNTEDTETTDWRPQGVTGFTWGSKKYLIVTWYGLSPNERAGVKNEHKGSKIALVDITDMNNISYTFILLAQNITNNNDNLLYDKPKNTFTQLGSFIPVTMHAGGVTYFNQKIYIADTSMGMRIFDLNNIIPVKADATQQTIGKEANGDLKAFDFAYILPQSGYYRMAKGSPFSCVGLGEGATPDQKVIYTGQYKTSGSISQVYGFPINANGELFDHESIVDVRDDLGSTLYGVQGVYRANKKLFLSVTGKASVNSSTARLVRYNVGDSKATFYPWPRGAEDLHADGDLLWSLTEFETIQYNKDNRCVFAVRMSDYP